MQERSSTLPIYSTDRLTYMPSTEGNHSIDSHSSSTLILHEPEPLNESSTSTPELNLLLDKLTEILRFRSGCRRQSSTLHPQSQQQAPAAAASTTNLKRLQSSSIEPLHNTTDATAMSANNSSSSVTNSAGAWKSVNNHHKSSISNRSSHHHHNQTNLSIHIHNLEKKRRLPSLLQRLIDEGNLIKEAVRRLKSQRFSHAFKQQQPNVLNTPSTPTAKPLASTQSHCTSSSSSSMAIPVPQQISDPPTQTTSSPNRGISWFLSSSVFGVNASATNHSSGTGSPLRTCYSSSTHDRTPMEIGIHDG